MTTTDNMSKEDNEMLHLAAGTLSGLFHKYGQINVLIYWESVRIRVEWAPRQMVEEDL